MGLFRVDVGVLRIIITKRVGLEKIFGDVRATSSSDGVSMIHSLTDMGQLPPPS